MMKTGADLWARAVQKLDKDEKQQLELDKRPHVEVLADLLSETETSRDNCTKKRWRFRRPNTGEVIILRDLFGKIVTWINLFKQVGDNAVQYDPQHAALPWAAVRFVLQVVVSDVVKFEFVVEAVETIARIISRYAIFEDLYLRTTSPATQNLEEALVGLYAAIILYLSKAKAFFLQSTPKRLLKSVFISEEEFEGLSKKIEAGQSEVDRCAVLVQTESHKILGDKLSTLTVNHHDGQAELLHLLSLIDGPISRMDKQLRNIEDCLEASERTKILTWISSEPYIEHHECITRNDVPERGKWLLEDPVYTQWHKASACSLLWLHGKVGSGKTTLTAIVVDDALQRSAAGQSPAPAYFFCSRNAAEPGRSNPDDILASIVRQLSCTESETSLSQSIVTKYQKRGQGFQSKGPRLDESRDLILDLIDKSSLTTIIIDALDEVDSEKRYALLDAIEDILQGATGLVKIFVSSRDDNDIVCTLNEYPSFKITSDHNQRDIEKFVSAETNRMISKRRLLRNSKCRDELRALIIRKVCDGADGMFRWATLQLELLCTFKLDADIRANLGRLPPGLGELYADIYENQITQYPGKSGRAVVQNVLKWMLCARTQMRSSEIRTAAAMTLPVQAEELSKEHVLDLCHNFIVFDDFVDTFRFAHLSVQEFLESRPEYTPISCHKSAAEACLVQIIGSTNTSITRDFLQKEYAFDFSSKVASPSWPYYRGGFHKYSALHWFKHCKLIGEEKRQSCDRFQNVFRFFFSPDCSDPSPLENWMLIYRRCEASNFDLSFTIFNASVADECASVKSFLAACLFGFCEMIRENSENPQISIGVKEDAVDIACSRLNDEALKTLLITGADYDISTYSIEKTAAYMKAETLLWVLQQTPNARLTISLMFRAIARYETLPSKHVDVLLSHFSTSDLSSMVLEIAAGYTTVDVLKHILTQRIDIQVSGEMLTSAVKAGNHEMVAMLMEEYKLKPTVSVFEELVKISNSKIIQTVLERGEYTISSSIMQKAVTNKDSGVTQLLLDHGGTISHSVLAMAAGYGYAPVLKMLLDRGHSVSKTMLFMGMGNQSDTNAMISLLLANVDHEMKNQQSQAMIKIAARKRVEELPDILELSSQLGCENLSEDILMAVSEKPSHEKIFNRLFKNFCDRGSLTTEIFGMILERVGSTKLVLEYIKSSKGLPIDGGVLAAAARNRQHGDVLLRTMLEQCPDANVSSYVWTAAVSNGSCGPEILSLLENHIGHFDLSEDYWIKAVSQRDSGRVIEYFFERFGGVNVTEQVLLKALRNESISMLLVQMGDFQVSECLLVNAARFCELEDFQSVWNRRQGSNVSSALLHAAAENSHNSQTLRFLLDKVNNLEPDKELIEAMVGTLKKEELVESHLAHWLCQVPLQTAIQKLLIPHRCNQYRFKKQVKFLVQHAHVGSISDEIFQIIAASGLKDILITLANHCKMGKIPSQWADIADLHTAATVRAWYLLPSHVQHDNDSCDPDAEILLVKDLLARKTPYDLPDYHGSTPLAHAARAGNELIVKALLDAGADPDSRDCRGKSPLFNAAVAGHFEIAVTLLDKRVKTDVVDTDGATLLERTRSYGHMAIYRLLQRHVEGQIKDTAMLSNAQ